MNVLELVTELKKYPADTPVMVYDLDYLCLEELDVVRLGEDDIVVILEPKF